MSFYCKLCNFSTQNKYNYNLHLDTNKHKQNEREKFKCDVCNKTFSQKQSLQRHFNSDAHQEAVHNNMKELLESKEKLKDLEHKLNISNLESNHRNEIIGYLKDHLNTTKKNLNKTNGHFKRHQNITDNTIKTFRDIIKKFPDAPLFKVITDCKEMQNGKTDEEFGKYLLEEHKNDNLHTVIGDYLLSYYKKRNPKLQSLWNINIVNSDYITKELNQWSKDMRGTRLIDRVIRPLIRSIELVAVIGLIRSRTGDETKKETREKDAFRATLERPQKLIKQTLKYIAPKLHYNSIVINSEGKNSERKNSERKNSESEDSENEDSESEDSEKSEKSEEEED